MRTVFRPLWPGVRGVLRQSLLAVGLGLFTSWGIAAPADIERGLAWLQAQVQADGTLVASGLSVGVLEQAHCETASTLLQLSNQAAAAQAFIARAGAGAAPQMATQIQACAARLGADGLASFLQERRVPAAGYAAYPGIAVSSSLDTGWAVSQLASLAAADRSAVLSWLQSQQGADGSFQVAGRPDLLATAAIVRGLERHATVSAQAAAIAMKGAAWLLSLQHAQGHWSNDVAVTSLVFEAVHPYSAANAGAGEAVASYVLAQQGSDGSWFGDLYVTAVALRALTLSQTAAPAPQASLRLRVVDAVTSAPIFGAEVELQLASVYATQTDGTGEVTFSGLPGQSGQLRVSKSGYATLTVAVQLQAGQLLDLGTLNLSSAQSGAASLTGFVRDATSGVALQGARVVVEPSNLQALTDAQGRYAISAIPPGDVTVVATREAYVSASSARRLTAGESGSLAFALAPAEPPGDQLAVVSGNVVSAVDSKPLANVKVVLYVRNAPTQVQYTAADGTYSFAPVIREIAVVQAEHPGYLPTASLQYLAMNARPTVPLVLRPGPDFVPAPDLRVLQVDKSGMATDPATLAAAGRVKVEIINLGRLAAPATARVTIFEDRNGNRRFDAATDINMGDVEMGTPLEPSERREFFISVSGTMLFRDAPVYAFADSAQAVTETDENNNLEACACSGGVPFVEDFNDGVADGAFEFGNQVGSRATWIVKDNYYEADMGGGVAFGDPRWVNYDAEVSVFFPEGTHNDAALAFRVVDEKNWYQFRAKAGHARILSRIGDAVTTHAEVPVDIVGNRWYRFRVEVRGKTVRALLDGQLIMTFDDLKLHRGRVGMMQDGVRVRYDDLRVFEAPMLEEDFSGPTHQLHQAAFYHNAPATVINGELVRNSYGSSWTGDPLWSDYSVQVDIKFPNGFTNDAGLLILAPDAPPAGSTEPATGRFMNISMNGSLIRFGVQGSVVRATSVATSSDRNAVYQFRAEISGKYVRWYMNDQFLFDFNELPWTRGVPGLIQDGVVAAYDNFKVWRTGMQRPDLTLSSLRVEAGNVVRMRVGNGGHGGVPPGVPVRVYLTQADGSKTPVAELQTTATLSRGGFEDLSVTIPALGSLAGGTLTAKVDDGTGFGDTVFECNEHNNSMSATFGNPPPPPPPPAPVPRAEAAVGQLAYSALDLLQGTVALVNAGSGAATATATVSIVAPDGGEVAVLAPVGFTDVAAGARVESPVQWVVPDLLAGAGYQLLAVLHDVAGSEVGRATATFSISAIGTQPALARITADRASYSASQAVRLSSRVGNATSNAPLEAVQAATEVFNTTGASVFGKTEPIEQLAPAGTRQYGYSLPASGLAAGSYSARLQLLSATGSVLAQSTTSFVVLGADQTGVGLVGTLQASPATLFVGQSTQLQLAATNNAAMALANVPLTVRLIDPETATVVATFSSTVDSLAPGQTRNLSYPWIAVGNHNQTLVAAASAQLGATEVNLAQTNLKLLGILYSGTLAADPVEVEAGSDVALNYSVANPAPVAGRMSGSLAVQTQAAQPLVSWPLALDIGAGSSFAGNQLYTTGEEQQTLTAVLSQQLGESSVVLATASFTIVDPPVPVGLQTGARAAARILVLVSCPPGLGAQEDAACVAQRSQAIQSYLSTLGYSAKTVSTGEAFWAELRCGTYNTYWLSGGAVKLDAQAVGELKAAVRRGDALWMDGVHDSRNQLLHEVAGVQDIGKLAVRDQVAQLAEGGLYGAGQLPTLGQPGRFSPTTGQAQGLFGTVPAVVSNDWGTGKSLLWAFDLAGMVTADQMAANGQLAAFVAASASHATSGTATLTVGDLTQISASVTNQGSRTVSFKAEATLPVGLTSIGTQPAAQLTQNTDGSTKAVWNFTLEGGKTQPLAWTVKAAQAGSYSVPLQVYSLPRAGSTAAPKLRAEASIEVQVQDGAALVQQPQLQVNAIQPTANSDKQDKTKAVSAVSQAQSLHAQGNYEQAIVQWLAAAEALARITSADTGQAQKAIALALEASTDALCIQRCGSAGCQ